MLLNLTNVLFVSPSTMASDQMDIAGTVVLATVTTAAYGSTFIYDDEEGRNQFYKAFLTTMGTTYALKLTVIKPYVNWRTLCEK